MPTYRIAVSDLDARAGHANDLLYGDYDADADATKIAAAQAAAIADAEAKVDGILGSEFALPLVDSAGVAIAGTALANIIRCETDIALYYLAIGRPMFNEKDPGLMPFIARYKEAVADLMGMVSGSFALAAKHLGADESSIGGSFERVPIVGTFCLPCDENGCGW
jgi:phage gp36-like protein